LYRGTITAKGVTALLVALEKTPSMKNLEIQDIKGAAAAYSAWKKGSGRNCKCKVSC
jgi:hypothetical protein